MDILIIDQPDSVKQLKPLIQKLGHTVIAYISTGEDAISKIIDIQPDMVFINLQLNGEMNGVETADMIKEMELPVVYLTFFMKNCLKKSWQRKKML